jgi:hypothetical protein
VFSLCLLVFVALVAVEPLNAAPAGVAGAGVERLGQFRQCFEYQLASPAAIHYETACLHC